MFVSVDATDFVEAASHPVRLHAGEATHLGRRALGELAARLDPAQFARIHRGTIVNVDRIREVRPAPSGDGIVVLHGGRRPRLSRHFRSALDLDPRSSA